MKNLLIILLRSIISGLRARQNLMLENAALRQQLGVLQRQVKRPRLTGSDRLFWVVLQRVWPRWNEMLKIVKPATVIAWHRAGYSPILAVEESTQGWTPARRSRCASAYQSHVAGQSNLGKPAHQG